MKVVIKKMKSHATNHAHSYIRFNGTNKIPLNGKDTTKDMNDLKPNIRL